jgi:hypothetical protein
MKSASFLLLLLAGLPATIQAQTSPKASSQSGELTGARPSGDLLAKSHAQATSPATSDSWQQHLLGTKVDLSQALASQLPDLYEFFITTTREERRQWKYADWDAAGQVLARLNQRYREVHAELPLEERVRIRSFQGEFRALRGARQVKEKID